jgi:nicotinamide-nucleotide amidase
VIAYSEDVKRRVLGVTAPRLITAECALQMATGALKVLGADLAVATTGVGGPGAEEGRPAGTVFVAVASAEHSEVREFGFAGGPTEVLAQTVSAALDMVEAALSRPAA